MRFVLGDGTSIAVVLTLLFSLLCVKRTVAWGVDGHEIVATIAQSQLHPDVRAHLCTILPVQQTAYKSAYPRTSDGRSSQHCHLAPFAAWADRVHQHYPWASHLHYVNPEQDEPPQHCTFGEYGWKDNGTGNVLEALVNYTSQLIHSQEKDIALRFLTHFMGDLHQPLHLTGRARGGNDVVVHFNGRYARLHSVWDSLMINDQIRDLANYTTPLRSSRIESALLGRRYDAYIRWILAEGLGQAVPGDESGWWKDEMLKWTECPESPENGGEAQERNHWLRSLVPHSSNVADRVYESIFRKANGRPSSVLRDPSAVDQTGLPICPYAWSKPMHGLVCSYAFADPVPSTNDRTPGRPLPELNVPEYAGRINDEKIIHRQLARAGIRLAAVLNTILLPEAQKARSAIAPAAHISHRITVKEPKGKHPKHGGHHSGGDKGSPVWGLIKVTASSIAEVVILSSVGYILARQGVLDKKTQTKINKVNVSVFTPALLFSKVAFSLDPGRLAELIIVPAGFVIITVVSAVAALLLSWTARLTRSQRNFSVACAITPNSNSLPVALMQSLVVTVPQLHWEEEGEPEDTVNGMLGRALTYLVLFSTLGMFLRWSLASKLLSTMEETDDELQDGQINSAVSSRDRHERQEDVQQERPRTGHLIDVESNEGALQPAQTSSDSPSSASNSMPSINVRRSTEDGGGSVTVSRPGQRQRSFGWARSFPNSPGGSDHEDESDDQTVPLLSPRWQRRQSTWTLARIFHTFVKKPFLAITGFMTMPLYAAVLSLVVALIPPLQDAISQIDPLVGALETAGACSIPLTMVVLGAYFFEETEETDPSRAHQQATTESTASEASALTPSAGTNVDGTDSTQATLVNRQMNGHSANKRKSLPFMRNASKHGDRDVNDSNDDHDSFVGRPWHFNALSSSGRLSLEEQREKRKQTMERRTIFVAVASRMVLTPIILLPLLAWYAIATRYNVVDDPVFLTSACLLIGSPPALTLAQITSQSVKGSNSSFERLISKTIFVSYAIAATPTTIILVMTALLIAQNDH